MSSSKWNKAASSSAACCSAGAGPRRHSPSVNSSLHPFLTLLLATSEACSSFCSFLCLSSATKLHSMSPAECIAPVILVSNCPSSTSRRRRLLIAVFIFWNACISTTRGFSRPSSLMTQFYFGSDGICQNPRYFQDKDTGQTFLMRNVPGDGDCMFLAATMSFMHNMGLDLGQDNSMFQIMAQQTRQTVSRILQSQNGTLVVDEKQQAVSAQTLLTSAIRQDDKAPRSEHDYLEKLEAPGGLYGGGPELTVLSNLFRRPISVYELCRDNDEENSSYEYTNGSSDRTCLIECKGTFGKGVFIDPLDQQTSAVWQPLVREQNSSILSWIIHILVLHVSLHEKHACVLIPVDTNGASS